jgi:4-amino-4-deoxy-L-arabinose transferase-like glycosyltransferase
MQRHDRRPLAASALVCAVLIYVYPLFLGTPLLDPDEGLHASISQGMVESGDYVIPRSLGQPFLDKPILYFAAQAASLRTFGMNEAAVRLPGLLFALLGAATTALLAWRLFDRDVALITLVISLTLAIPLALAQAAAHDVALVPWTNLTWLFLWEADRAKSPKRLALCVGGQAVCVALALLTKGLIGVAVVFCGYALFIAATREITWRRLYCGAIALALGAIAASPWFLAMERQSPGYLHYYFIQRHFMGFATGTQEHGHEPWFYYLPQLLGGSMPWTLYLAPGLWQSWNDRRHGIRQAGRPTLMIYCWVFGGLIFLSLASSKLITYALPLYPALAILIGRDFNRFLNRDLAPAVDAAFIWLLRSLYAAGCVFPLLLLVGLDRYTHIRSPLAAYAIAAAAAAPMIIAFVLLARQQRIAAVAVGTLWFAVLFVAVMTWPIQSLADDLSQKALAQRLAASRTLPHQVIIVGQRVGSLIFYLTPDQRHAMRPGQFVEKGGYDTDSWAAIPPDVLLAVTANAVDEMHNLQVKAEVTLNAASGTFHWALGAVHIADRQPTVSR